MRTKSGQSPQRFIRAVFIVCAISAVLLPAQAQKLKVEDVVARHLEAIGPAAARTAVKTRNATGAVEAVLRIGGVGTIAGKAQILSEARKLRMIYSFNLPDYPGEDIAFDGESVEVGWVRPGQRSSFSQFLYSFDMIAKEGLLGGILSTAWPLADLEGRQAKVEYSGLKKFEGKPVHELKYKAKKGQGDFQISLYFDAETFRHVRTQYKVIRGAQMASEPLGSSAQQDTVYTLTEAFSDFKQVDSLTLPMLTRLDLTVEGQNATLMTKWTFTIGSVLHNQSVDPKLFSIR